MSNTRSQVLLAAMLLSIAVVILNRAVLKNLLAEARPIRHIQVEGAFQYIDKQDIKASIEPLVQQGYFSVDLQAIQSSVLDLPWAEKVKVQRIWPDRLKLRIYEQKPVLRWQAKSLLNVKGDIFTPMNIDRFQILPVLYAPVEQRHQYLQVMDGLRLSLIDQGLHLTEFRVSERQSWLLAMENGMIIQLGRFQPLQKFTRLMQALIVIESERVDKIAYVDMRYPNGYAVRWREGEQIIWE